MLFLDLDPTDFLEMVSVESFRRFIDGLRAENATQARHQNLFDLGIQTGGNRQQMAASSNTKPSNALHHSQTPPQGLGALSSQK